MSPSWLFWRPFEIRDREGCVIAIQKRHHEIPYCTVQASTRGEKKVQEEVQRK